MPDQITTGLEEEVSSDHKPPGSAPEPDSGKASEMRPWLPAEHGPIPAAKPRQITATTTTATTATTAAIAATKHERRPTFWARRGLWLGAFAIVSSFLCTLLLVQDEPVRTRAWVGLVLSGVLAVVAWGGTPWFKAIAHPASWWPLERLTFERILRLCGIGLSIFCTWLADRQFVDNQTVQFGLAGWLWLAGIVLLVASTAGWPLPGQKRFFPFGILRNKKRGALEAHYSGPSEVVQSTEPLNGLADASLPVRPARSSGTTTDTSKSTHVAVNNDQPKWSRWEVALFLGIVALAVVVRTWDLTAYPYAIHPDEILTGYNATQFFITGNQTSIFQTVWYGINLPTLWFALVAGSLNLGGSVLAFVRLPSALFGAAAVLPFYFLLRSMWGRAAAIAGTAFMAFGVTSIHFSRVTVNNIVTPFFWLCCFCFLLRGLRRGRPLDWALAGLFGGLSEHFYYGTRLLPFILVLFALYLLVIHWRQTKYYLLSFGLVAIGYFAAFGPLLAWFMLNPDLYFGRGSQVLTWNHIPASLDDLKQMWDTLWPIFSHNLLTISAQKATDSLYGGSMLMPVEAALLALGVALLIWRWRQPGSFLLLLSGFGVLFVGGTLVPDAANLNHWTAAFPSFYAALALPVAGLAWASGRFLSHRRQYVGIGLLAAGLIVLGGLNIHYYFSDYQMYRPEFDIPAAKARFQAQLGPNYRVRSVGRTWQDYDSGFTSYLVKGIDGGQIWNPAAELPMTYAPWKGLAFTFFADQVQYLSVVEQMYPGGDHGQVNSQGGVLLYDYYVLQPSAVDAMYGAQLQLWEPAGSNTSKEEKVETIGALPAGVTYPLKARWTALMNFPSLKGATLSVQGAQATILFDGQSTLPTLGHTVQPGWHQVSVEAALDRPTAIKLMLTEGEGATAEVVRGQLWPVEPNSGLLGSVAAADSSVQRIVRYDPFIGFTDLQSAQAIGPQEGAGGPFRVRWTGELLIPEDGSYQLEVVTNGQARLFVGGAGLLKTCAGNDPAPADATLTLSAGWHPIQLDYQAGDNSHTLELYWRGPDGQRSMIPPSAFRFAPSDQHSQANAPDPPGIVDCNSP